MQFDFSRVRFTKHAIERFAQRCSKKLDKAVGARASIIRCLKNCEENRSMLNDTAAMLDIYEKYGFDTRYTLMTDNSTVFVIVDDNSNPNYDYALVTVIHVVDTARYGRMRSAGSNFRQRPKKPHTKKETVYIKSHKKMGRIMANN